MDTLLAMGPHLRVSEVAILETVFVLESVYQFSRNDVASALRTLIGQAVLDFDHALWTEVVNEYLVRPKLSCADIFLVLDAKRSGATPLMSFDKKLVTQMGAVTP